jgi:hypothetical protein
MSLNNPLASSFTLISLTSSVLFQGKVIGTVDQSSISAPIVVGPNKSGFDTPFIKTTLKVSLSALQALTKMEEGTAFVNVGESVMNVKVGDYPVTITYHQDNIPITATN